MELNRDYFFETFDVYQHGKTAWINLIQFLATKLHQRPVLVHSRMNFVKVIQNQLLFRKPLILCVNYVQVQTEQFENSPTILLHPVFIFSKTYITKFI